MKSEIDRTTYEGDHTVCRGIEQEFINTREVAQRLRWSVRTIRSKIRAGVFRQGEHFFQPPGCQARWKWSAIVEWIEGKRTAVVDSEIFRLPVPGRKDLL